MDMYIQNDHPERLTLQYTSVGVCTHTNTHPGNTHTLSSTPTLSRVLDVSLV